MREIYILSVLKKINPYVLFLILCAVIYLPASLVRSPIPPDEVRSIHIAQNMNSFQTCLFPVHLGRPYYDKPPLYFWLLSFFLKCTWCNFLFLPALFNALCAWVILCLNYLFFKKEGMPRMGIYSSLFLSTTVIFYAMTFILRMDILFLMFIFLAVFFFWFSIKDKKPAYLFLSAAFTFLAVFTKGALGIIFPLFIEIAMCVFRRDSKAFGKVLMVNLLAGAGVFLWLFSFDRLQPGYFKKMVFDQTVSRGWGKTEHPFLRIRSSFYYLPYLFLLFLPWSFIGAGYFLTAAKSKKYHWEKVYLVWYLGGFILLSLLRSKQEMYLLLLSIPFCAVTAKFFLEGSGNLKKNKKESLTRFRNFFVFWLGFLQVVNLVCLPMVSWHQGLKRVADAVKKLDVDFDKIYVKDRLLLQLSAYKGVNKPVLFWEENACPAGANILISQHTQDEQNRCSTDKILQIGQNRFFYKQR